MKIINRILILPLLIVVSLISCRQDQKTTRPNILLIMSDNQSWNHLGCYGDPVVKTPNIDKIAEQGVKFTQAYCAAPSCSPARAGMLTGQDIWRLEDGANLHGILPKKFLLYTDLLQEAGYFVGAQGKGWGPGNVKDSGRKYNPGGEKYNSFSEFLNANKDNKPWTFWFSSHKPHRPYKVGSGVASGMDINKVVIPKYLPDNDIVRGDICDYYYDIQKFDDQVGDILNTLKKSGQYDNTLIVICSDNGWQMPRGLANLYDFGTRVPLIFAWIDHIPMNRTVDDFANLNDLAPTFLEIANGKIPEQMTAKSLTNILFSKKEGHIDKDRNFIVTARERHALCRKNGLGYPGRAIRTEDFLYIRNFNPERWPAGDPPLYGDVDAHMLHYACPTKLFILKNKDKPDIKPFFELGFAKRPAEELFDVRTDPDQINNVAYKKEYKEIKKELSDKLLNYLKETKDPRIIGGDIIWDTTKYYATGDFKPKPNKEAIKMLHLKKEYNYYPEK
ncbi:Sulfatase [hydrothermal vent metagenome]|uniref:Sulfatase n=1 Tax=hydrothermal vent metagenome TaxID=652676 RepID=A0A3B1CSV8_9ZZZZ